MITFNKLYNEICLYIEQNKTNYNIEYKETIETLMELLEQIKSEYENIIKEDQ